MDVGEHREILVDVAVDAGDFDFLAEDSVRILENIELFLGDVAEDTYGKSGARERLTPDKIFGDTELESDLADLVFKQVAQGLYELIEIDVVGQSADIVVALDDRRSR